MSPAEFHASFIATLRTRPANATDALILRDWLMEQGVQPWTLEADPGPDAYDRTPLWARRQALPLATDHVVSHTTSRTWRETLQFSRQWFWETEWDLLACDFPDALLTHLLLVQVESLTPTP